MKPIKNALVVGGSSGLGREMALRLIRDFGYRVCVTGRKCHPLDTNRENLSFFYLDSDSQRLNRDLDNLVFHSATDLFIFSAGFYQSQPLEDLTDEQIDATTNLGINVPAKILRRILEFKGQLPGLIAITSTSQWTPRLNESIYCASKAGLAMLAKCSALNPKIKKVLVAAPSGMDTPFYRNTRRNTSGFLDPGWTAIQILSHYFEYEFEYKFVKILRKPAKVEVVEERKNPPDEGRSKNVVSS